MRILLDECIPRRLKRYLLLKLAESEYDVFLTLDKGVQYQQNLSDRKIGVVVVRALSNRIEDLTEHVPACLAVFDVIVAGQVVRIPLVQ